MGATLAYPALLTTTSRRPNRSRAAAIDAAAAAASVTSSGSGRMRSPEAVARSASCSGRRAVATTASPVSSAARTSSRPNPRDDPVMNQTLLMISSSSVRDSAGVRRGVALSHDPPGREYVTQISNFVDADCDRSGREILPDVRNALSSRNRYHIQRLCQQPRQGQLSRPAALVGGQLGKG